MSGSGSGGPSALSLDAKQKEDLDIFLSTIESKLRGPFSSLDLAKSVTTTALRKGALTPKQYLHQVSQVIGRTDKVVQLRMIIGLLGLDPPEFAAGNKTADGSIDQAHQINPEIYKILQLSQDSNEEWVKTISGLVQGIMFQDAATADEMEDESNRESSSSSSCRGEHAQKLLEKTSAEILQRIQTEIDQEIQQQEQKAAQADNDDDGPAATAPNEDLNASFAPYRYSLVPQQFLECLIPEMTNGRNPHFQTNTDAAILKMDEALDAQRAKEEHDHQNILSKSGASNGGGGSKAAAGPTANKRDLPPGYRPAQLVRKTSKKDPPKTNMFMTKKPGMAGGMPKSRLLQKTVLRRKGAAQSLVSKSSMKAKGGGGAAGAASAGAAGSAASTGPGMMASKGAASKFGGGRARAMMNRSKMKMIDVQEVDTLNKEHAKRDEHANSRSSKKRRILELAAQRGLGNKKTKTEPQAATATAEQATAPEPAAPPAAPAIKVEQPPEPMDQDPPQQAQPHDNNNNNNQQQPQHEWQILLKERSNKLSEEDRVRVQQFFESHYNPTPDQPVYKMKLHEHRTNDATTGQAIKETFYLELDYQTFTSKQSKKVKRY